jgi:hypothetical protein
MCLARRERERERERHRKRDRQKKIVVKCNIMSSIHIERQRETQTLIKKDIFYF